MAVFICQSCGNEHSSWEGKCPNCGHTEIIKLNQASDRMIEKTIKGKYKIVRKLGQGGMGAVYLAEQVGIGHRVALKFLKSEFSNDVEIARRFMNEAKSYARVAHPNAVVFHDFGQDDEGNLFIAMEYCEGVDLKKVISESKRMQVGDAVDVVLQVADVLANAHSKGVIHRDLKPENIMLRKGMRGIHAKVLDFGIARLMNEGTRLTVQGAIAGTPRYMSPEQVEGKEVDARSDLYALGIVTFECITGVQPFDGGTIAEILRKQVLESMPHLRDISPDLDFVEIDKVIQKAVAKKPDDRYPDMLAFASALSEATPTLAGRGGTAMNAIPHAATPRPAFVPTEVEGTQKTMVRQETASIPIGGRATDAGRPAVSSPTLQGDPSILNQQLDGRSGPSDASLVVPPQKSKGPLIGIAVVVVLAAAAAVWAFRPKPNDVTVPPPPVVVKNDPVPPNTDPTPPPQVDPTPKNPGTGVAERDIERGRDYLARGKNAWDRGELAEAQQYFKDVPEGTEFRPSAADYLSKIESINQKLSNGTRQCGSGEFDKGLSSLNDAARLNSAVAAVQGAIKRCQNARPPSQFE